MTERSLDGQTDRRVDGWFDGLLRNQNIKESSDSKSERFKKKKETKELKEWEERNTRKLVHLSPAIYVLCRRALPNINGP